MRPWYVGRLCQRNGRLYLIQRFGRPETHLIKGVFADLYKRDAKAAEYFAAYRLSDGRHLPDEVIEEYTTNASVLNTALEALTQRSAYRKKKGASTRVVFDIISRDVEEYREACGHTLKIASLRRTLREYKEQGYTALISGKWGNKNTKKVKSEEQEVMIEELLKLHNNLDNQQVANMYNLVAKRMNWKDITSHTVGRIRKEKDLYTYSGRRGATNFRHTRSMQVKRKAPSAPMLFWTLDGWDVELLYQARDNKKGITTYHNRPTVVVILDPFNKYPIGYAIGTHETPELIKQAMRNAINHTKQLFGHRYKPLQIQSDRYGNGALTPLYEAMTLHYTPAAVKNAKAKVVEPYFLHLNKKYCQVQPNWSGFGVTSSKELQPNDEYLNKIRHQFPDYQGVVAMVEHFIMQERAGKAEAFIEQWHHLPDVRKMVCTDEEYLYLFGQTTGFTNRLEASGLNPTLEGAKYFYDCFDLKFREMRHIDWIVKYDPEDLTTALAVNAEKRNGNITEMGTYRFLLELKHEQPMALADRIEGDAEELDRVRTFNKTLENTIVERTRQNREVIDSLFTRPELDDTLTKLMLVDSKGQHKNNRNERRISEPSRPKQIEAQKDEVYEVILPNVRDFY
jgi:hypothetical protein